MVGLGAEDGLVHPPLAEEAVGSQDLVWRVRNQVSECAESE